jgi:hypothetical protein
MERIIDFCSILQAEFIGEKSPFYGDQGQVFDS